MEPAHAHPPPGFILRDRGGEPLLLLLLGELRDRAMMLEGQKFVSHRRSDVARDAGEIVESLDVELSGEHDERLNSGNSTRMGRRGDLLEIAEVAMQAGIEDF